MHKVFINVARGHERALASRLSRERSSASSLARSMRQTTVNQWASSAGSHPGIFPDGQWQQQQQHAPHGVGGKGAQKRKGEVERERGGGEWEGARARVENIEKEQEGRARERDSENAAGA